MLQLNEKQIGERSTCFQRINGDKEWVLNGQLHREDGPAVEYASGSKEWYINGQLHREDGPAVECADGSKFWYINGKCHREDGPAVELANGSKSWYINGKKLTEQEFKDRELRRTKDECGTVRYYNANSQLHREDGPAVEYASGSKEWYLNGQLHREDGPAIEWASGSKSWYLNDQRHREDGPAVERADGSKEWWVNGRRHREDGPAVECVDGTKEWWINGKRHREDGPAIEYAGGSKYWWINGKRHREDGPAVEWAGGSKEWYLNGKLQLNRIDINQICEDVLKPHGKILHNWGEYCLVQTKPRRWFLLFQPLGSLLDIITTPEELGHIRIQYLEKRITVFAGRSKHMSLMQNIKNQINDKYEATSSNAGWIIEEKVDVKISWVYQVNYYL